MYYMGNSTRSLMEEERLKILQPSMIWVKCQISDLYQVGILSKNDGILEGFLIHSGLNGFTIYCSEDQRLRTISKNVVEYFEKVNNPETPNYYFRSEALCFTKRRKREITTFVTISGRTFTGFISEFNNTSYEVVMDGGERRIILQQEAVIYYE